VERQVIGIGVGCRIDDVVRLTEREAIFKVEIAPLSFNFRNSSMTKDPTPPVPKTAKLV
jgi:hypothetical protein